MIILFDDEDGFFGCAQIIYITRAGKYDPQRFKLTFRNIDPMTAGNGMASLVMVNELRDAKAVEQALTDLCLFANDAMEEAMIGGPLEMKIRFLNRKIEGGSIVSLGVPYVSPSCPSPRPLK